MGDLVFQDGAGVGAGGLAIGGHTPFGYMGEKVLNKLNPNGFKHANQSLRVNGL